MPTTSLNRQPQSPAAGTDAREQDDARLVGAAIAHDLLAWRELMRRHTAALLEAARDAGSSTEVDADELVARLWRWLADDDMRQLRAFDATRGAALLSWLAVRLCRLADAPPAAPASPAETPPEPLRDTAGANNADSPFLTVEAVARRWALDRKTVYAMIDRGQLSARRCGRLVRIPRKLIESFESQASVSPERDIKCR
jgi:excisionase family DNA binding protein